jgi:pimeloyl-ACP methyl ester carboxylesterase
MANFVLVHGAWHGGWCWVRVAQQLRLYGHRVVTPTLTGLGERAHLLTRDIDLDTHITDIAAVIETEELRDVVLCGHSYGGCVIAGVADRAADSLSAVVYLDAFIPADGQCMIDLVPPKGAAAMTALAHEKGEGWKVPPRSAESFQVASAEDRDWVDRRCVPHPFATMTQPVRLTGAGDAVPVKSYIRAAKYGASPFGPFAERAKNDPGWRYEDIECGHDVMVDAPDELVDALIRASE